MKKILILITMLFSLESFGQTWSEKIASKFYTKIDSAQKLECCNHNGNDGFSLKYQIPVVELPYSTYEEVYQNYYSDVIDSSFINTIVDDMVKTYKKMPLRIRKRISKSCYNIQTVTKTTSNIDSGLIWAEGEVNLSFNFQLNKPYKRYWFKRVLGIF
jgi:hypothetical protein